MQADNRENWINSINKEWNRMKVAEAFQGIRKNNYLEIYKLYPLLRL